MLYLVEERASHENCLHEKYSHTWIAFAEGGFVSQHYDSNHQSEYKYNHFVRKEFVESESGYGAIQKLIKWANQGLDKAFLTNG